MIKTGVVGYGKMGKGIFNLLSSLDDYAVTVWLRDGAKAKEFQDQAHRRLNRALKKGIINQEQFQEKLSGLIFTNRLEDLGSCTLVVESIVEDFQQKTIMLQKLDSILSPSAILVTNTSSLSINKLAARLKHAERFCGFHFFYPLPLVNLVEVINWKNVSPKTINRMLSFARHLGKEPIIINDAPASGINDILSYYYLEALYILEQGLAPPSQIDSAALNFSRVGPCESVDIIGIKLLVETLARTVDLRKEGMIIPELLYKLISHGRLGRDEGKGLFIHQGEKMEDDRPEFYPNTEQNHSYDCGTAGQEAILKRLLYSLFNGFLYSVSRGISSEKELDIGIKEVLGMRQGPATLMKSIGIDKVMNEFNLLAQSVGIRFRQ